mmetsp:Transcript_3148/g.4191  ORF Transcript_3148/g.4191 Transcript_3148/m.4191 type:complete len:235 (+) Transcript_3148:101-805(+)
MLNVVIFIFVSVFNSATPNSPFFVIIMCPSSPITNNIIVGKQCEQQYKKTVRSLAIPLPESHIHRTESEQQLCEDMAMAEYRDRCMFNRLVSGIRRRQQLHYNVQWHQQQDMWPQQPTFHQGFPIHPEASQQTPLAHGSHDLHPLMQDSERTIENIISTRCRPVASVEKGMTPTTFAPWCQESKVNNSTRGCDIDDNDWAIEGFDSPVISSRPIATIIQDWDDSEIHHVFDIEL